MHLTVGVDTHIWGLNFASLRDSSFKRSGLNDKVLLTKLDDSLYWDLQVGYSSLSVCYLYLSTVWEGVWVRDSNPYPDSTSIFLLY